MGNEERRDVVIVGGGIAGAALATLLARAGLDVVVLERQLVYEDRVRGEWMAPWGIALARRLALYDVIAAPGASAIVNRRFCFYDAVLAIDEAERSVLDLGTFLPGEPGGLFLSHPETCAALAEAASAAGADVRRGVAEIKVAAGAEPEATFRVGETAHRIRCRLIVGADGRNSVVRRQLGLRLEGTAVETMWAGLLVDGLDDWAPGYFGRAVSERAGLTICVMRAGRARLYLQYPVSDHPAYSGPDRVAAFLAAFDECYLPAHEQFRAARPAGPCAGSPAGDTWTRTPVVPGAVLVGDAAGYVDPLLANGLSLALADVAHLAALLAGGAAAEPDALAPYAEDRAVRQERARFATEVVSEVLATFGREACAGRLEALARMATDPELNGPFLSLFMGFDTYPDRGRWREIRRRVAGRQS